MISHDRFIARSSDRQKWLEARAEGVTATMVAKAAGGKVGFDEVIRSMSTPADIQPNAVMAWGNEREPVIADVIKSRFGILPNEWLIAKDAGASKWQMATPDGLSISHDFISEIKTTGKPLDKIPAHYMRQIQWQLWVTDAVRCLFAYELRLEGPEGFVPGFDVVTQWVDRDEDMIAKLVATAEQLQMDAVYRSWERD